VQELPSSMETLEKQLWDAQLPLKQLREEQQIILLKGRCCPRCKVEIAAEDMLRSEARAKDKGKAVQKEELLRLAKQTRIILY